MERDELIRRWWQLYDAAPPPFISRKLMIRILAYRVQEQVFGGLRPATRRMLERIAAEAAETSKVPLPYVLKPGTRLLREWHGFTYEVTVLEEDVLFNGRQYASLTKVATEITGVKWSGPLFFGLKKRKGST